MKISIGQRLFAAVLLAIAAVSAAGLAVMRANVLHSFSNYAAKIELDRLQGLADSLQAQYGARAGWSFLPPAYAERTAWVREELERLSDRKLMAAALQMQRAQSLQQLQQAQARIRAAEQQIRSTEAEESALLGRVAGADTGMDALRDAQERLRIAREQRYSAKSQVLEAKEDVLAAREQLQEIERLQPGSLEAAAAAVAAAQANGSLDAASAPAGKVAPPAPPKPAGQAPLAPLPPLAVPPAAPATPPTTVAQPHAPAPPAAPALSVKPAAAPAVPPAPSAATPAPSRHEAVTAALDTLSLQDRIALTAADGSYLAGRPLDGKPAVERPLLVGGKTVGHLRVTKAAGPSDALAEQFLAEQKRSLLLLAVTCIVLSALAAMLLAAHFRKPIGKLVAGARQLAKGRFDTRLDIARSDELGELAASFNQMAGRLERIEQSRRQWVADTSHELRTPLSVLRAQVEAMQDGVRQPTPENIATMLRHVLALSKLVDELYELARADEGNFDYAMTPTVLWPLIVEEAGGFADKLVQAGLTLSLGPTPARSRVLCDPDRLRQIFCNLFENSVRYTTAGGRIEVRAFDEAGRLTVTVDDTAPAVPEEALARLAERFFRVEQSRNRRQGGSGLGLAMCQRIVEAHGGTLDFAHSPLGGLRVTLTFPLEQEQA